MTTFVKGVLVEKQGVYGIYYEIKLRLSSGQIIPVFYAHRRREVKDVDPISELLEAKDALNSVYEVVICMDVLRSITYLPVTPPDTSFELVTKEIPGGQDVIKRNDLIRGKVLDPSWDAASLHYQAIAAPRIYEQRYVVLETGIGNVVISHRTVQEELTEPVEQLVPGGYLEWKRGRMDLLAIIERREKEPADVS